MPKFKIDYSEYFDDQEVEADEFALAGNDHQWLDFRSDEGGEWVTKLRVRAAIVTRVTRLD